MRLGLSRAGKAPEFSAGNETSVEIRQNFTLRALQLRIRGSLVVTGGAGAGTYHTDAAHRIARRLSVDYDGETRLAVMGVDLASMEALFQPQARVQTFPTALAAATYPLDVVVEVPFYMPHAYGNAAFALPTKLVDAPLLRVQWGAAEDLAYGNDGALTFSGMSVELYEVPMLDIPPPVRGMFSPLLLNTSDYRVLSTVTEEVHELPFLQGGRELRALLVTAANEGVGDSDFRRSDAVLTRLGLTVNAAPDFELAPGTVIQRQNAVDYGLSSVRTGVYVLDAAPDMDVRPGAVWTINRGVRPFARFDAAFDGGAGQHIVRFLTIATDGRAAAGAPRRG